MTESNRWKKYTIFYLADHGRETNFQWLRKRNSHQHPCLNVDQTLKDMQLLVTV